MQLSRHLRPAEWLFFIAWLALITFGYPLHVNLEPEELAARPALDRTHLSPTMLNANDNIPHNAMRHNLQKRRNRLNFIQFTRLRYILPVGITAQSLKFFYEAIALKASGALRNLLPERALAIIIENPVLGLLFDGPIPWDLVTHFADTIVHAGITTTYDNMYMDQMLSASVAIALRVIHDATGLEVKSQRTRILETVKPHKDQLCAPLRTGLRIRKKAESQSNLTSRSVSLSSTKASKSPTLNVKPRTPPLSTALKGFKMEKFHVTAIITPVMTAAQFLEDFYDLIALKIETGFWNNVPPLHSLVLTRWDYQLKFFCYAAPIPWDFIQEVAIDMSEWAAKGFTAQFDAVYKAVDQFGKEIFVSVALEFMKGDDNRDGGISTWSDSGP